MGIEFGVLGGVWARRDGQVVDLGGHRQRSVVARLLVAGGAVVPADVLVADLWHAETPPRAMAALQAHVSHLRRALEPDRPPRAPAGLLVTVPPGYALRPDAGAVDAVRAVQLLDEGDRLLAGDPATARARYSAALELWRGPAYAEYAGEPWAAPEAARLDELRLGAVERRAAAALAAPAGRDPLPGLRAHVAEHPLREEGWRLLALGLYRAGRQGEALAALREARQRLADELGVDPGPALRALEDDVLTQAPHLLPCSSTTPAPPTHRPDPPAGAPPAGPRLVGRGPERTALRQAAGRAAGGGLQVAVVTGEPGSGKSALVEELAADLTAAGWTTVLARCPETDGAPSGWPWVEALRRLAATRPPADTGPLAALLGNAPAAEAGDPAGQRFQLHRAVAAWLAATAARAPLLVVLDDLHRADSETTRLLLDLLPSLAAAPVLVVVTSRPEPDDALAEVRAALARRSPTRLDLAGLAPADVDSMIDALTDELATPAVGAPARAVIAEHSGGNPFYVRELVRLAGSGADVAGVPGSVRDVVRQRLAALPAQTVTLLRLAAVCGRDVDVDVLLAAAAAGTGDGGQDRTDALVEALEAALVSGLLLEPGPGRLRFVHALVRDTLYDDLSGLRAGRLHGTVARVLERLRPGDVTALAHHSAAAGPGAARATLRWAQEAAELAGARFAHRDAARWWQRARAALDVVDPADATTRVRLLAAQARAAAHAGDQPSARALRREAVAALPPDAPLALVGDVLTSSEVPSVWSARTWDVDTRVVALAADLAASGDGPDALRSRVLSVVALEWEGIDPDRAAAAAEEAVVLARRSGAPVALAHALHAAYFQSYRPGSAQPLGPLAAELAGVARAAGLGAFETLARQLQLQDAAGRLDLAAADALAAETQRLALAHGLPLAAGVAAFYPGFRHALAGRRDAAEAAYDVAVAEVAATGYHRLIAPSLRWIALFPLRVDEGRLDGLVEETAAVAAAAPLDFAEMTAAALVLEGRTAEARVAAAASRPRTTWDTHTPIWHWLQAVVGLGLDDRARMEQARAGLAPHTGTVCGAWTAAVAMGPTDTVLARLAARLGDRAGAEAHQRAAVAVAERVGNAAWLAAAVRAPG